MIGCSGGASGAVGSETEAPTEVSGAIYNASPESDRGQVAPAPEDDLQANLDIFHKRTLIKCQVDYFWIGGCVLINTYCTKNGIDYNIINQDLKCPPVFLMPKIKYSDPPIDL